MKYKKQIITIFSLIIASIFIWYFFKIFLCIIIATVLALLGSPIVKFLDKIRIKNFKLPHTINATITLLFMFAVIITFFALIIPVLGEQITSISKIDTKIIENTFAEPIKSLENNLRYYQIIDENKDLNQYIANESVSVVNKFKFSDIFSNIISFISSLLGSLFIITFITFFLLRDNKIFYRLLLAMLPSEYHDELDRIKESAKKLLTRYFLGLIIDISFVITLYTIFLYIFGVKNALLIGFLAGIVNVVPYVGPFIGASLAIFIGTISGLPMDFNKEFFPLITTISIIFIGVNLFDALVMQPNIYAKSVKAHPLEIFFVIIIAGTFAGIIGMIFAIPSYTFIRIIAREFFNKYAIIQKLTNSIKEQ